MSDVLCDRCGWPDPAEHAPSCPFRAEPTDGLREALTFHLAGRAVTLSDGRKGLLRFDSVEEIVEVFIADMAGRAS